MGFPNILTAWRAAGRGGDVYSGSKDWSTPFSSVSNGMASIDPSLRQSQDASLTTYLGQNAETRNRYMGNQSAFRQALLDPLRQQYATRRGELERSTGLRGMAGSSFADQALTNLDTEANRQIGNRSAEAENMDLQAMQGLDQASMNATMQTRSQQYAQELAALGLGQQQIAQLMGQFNNEQARKLAQVGNYNQTLNEFHSLVTDWGDFTKLMGGGSGSMGCYIAAFHFGPWTVEHFLIARHVHTAKSWKAKLARVIYKALYPLFKALLKEAKG